MNYIYQFKDYIAIKEGNILDEYSDITVVYIRDNKNTISSTDFTCYKLGDATNEIQKYNFKIDNIRTEKIEMEGKMYNVHNITLYQTKEIISRTDYRQAKKNIYEFLLKNGYSDDIPDKYKDVLDQNFLKYKINYEKERENKGYVLTKYDIRDQKPIDYVGGFDLDIIFKETLISYTERGLVFGYIGHNARKVWVDKLMAKHLLKYIKPDDFACWLTSSDGRHFADKIENYVEAEDRDKVEDIIIDNIPKIHDLAVIYNSPEHKGNLKSTKELFTKYQEMGMMLQDEF